MASSASLNSIVAITKDYVDIDVDIDYDGVTPNTCPRYLGIWVDIRDLRPDGDPLQSEVGDWSGYYVGIPANAWWGNFDVTDAANNNTEPPLFTRDGGAQVFSGVVRLLALSPLDEFEWDGFPATGKTVDGRLVLGTYLGQTAGPIFPFEFPTAVPECTLEITDVSVGNVSDVGETDGTITVTISNSTGDDEEYSLNGGAPQSSNVFTGLASGTYTILVEDSLGCTAETEVTVSVEGGTFEIMDSLEIEVREVCGGICLSWLNTLGGIDHFVFEDTNKNFETTLRTKISSSFERYVEQLDEATNFTGITGKEVEKSITLGAEGISAEIYEGLLELFISTSVYMLTSQNPITWQAVTISAGSVKYSESARNIEFTIELPNIKTQRA